MTKTLKEQTTSAVFWNFMDKGGQQFLQFIFIFVLVRILSPRESGLVALLAIFIAVANIFQESGFSSALIRKVNADQSDYSSVFYFNIAISFLIYLVLFIISPFIARFYDEPILTNLSRFLFLTFIFNAFAIIQNVQLVKKMDFKTNARITLSAVFISGIIAIIFAYYGYGAWSLALQQVTQTFMRTLLLWIFVKWRPSRAFQFARIKAMYNYSSKLLLNSLFNQISANIVSIVLGRRFAISDVGNYSQAYKIANIPQSVIATSLSGVTFPLLNKVGDDVKMKNKIFRKIVRIICFVCFPLAAFTFVSSESIVLVLLENKWIGVIPILKYLAIGSSVLPLIYLLTSLLQSLGKSGLLLTLEFAKNIVTILVIFITSRLGINAMVLGISIVYITGFLVQYYITGKLINYTLKQILKDILPYIAISLISFLPLIWLSYVISNHLLLLFMQGTTGIIIYLAIVKALGSKVLDDLIRMIRKKPLI